MIETADTLSAKNGYLVGPEVPFLRRLAGMLPGERPLIVNIGVGTGASAFALLEGNPKAEVVSIDIDATALNESVQRIIEAGYAARHRGICGDSIRAALDFEAGPADMVFFDCGRHEYGYLLEEVPAWANRVTPRWIAAFHDALQPDVPVTTYSNDPPAVKAFTEVTQFVAEFPTRFGWAVKPIGHERLLAAFLVGE